jgi:CHRD domain
MGFRPSRAERVTLKSVKKLVLIILALAAVATAAGAVSAATRPHRMVAHLTTRVEVPKPVRTRKKVFGAFTGSYVVQPHAVRLTWKLSFVRLTGSATGVTLSKGKPGLIGKQITVVKALESGQAYVTVYTRRNPAGEIRGQIRVKR